MCGFLRIYFKKIDQSISGHITIWDWVPVNSVGYFMQKSVFNTYYIFLDEKLPTGNFFFKAPPPQNFSSAQIFLAIRNKKTFLNITYRLVLRGGGALKKSYLQCIVYKFNNTYF